MENTNKIPLWPIENGASGTTSAEPAGKKDEKLIPDPKPKRLFVPYAYGRGVYRSKQASLTAADRKSFQDFAAKAKVRFEEIKKSKSNI